IRTADGSGAAAPTTPATAAAPAAGGHVEPDIVIAGPGSGHQLGSREVRLGHVDGRPVILVAPDAGAEAAGLFSRIWTQAAAGTALTVNAVDQPKNEANAVSLQYLGAKPASFDVLAHA